MEEELRQKMYDMHGTVERLDQKMDSIMSKQGSLENEVKHLNEDIDKVSQQANANQRKLYGVFLLGGVGGTTVVAVATLFSSAFP